MEDWRAAALTRFPEFEHEINRNIVPLGLWSDLYLALTRAYEARLVNDDLVGRIYDYASWCFRQPATGNVDTDLPNATAVGFIEDLPLDRAVFDDLYRWFSKETFEGFEGLFRVHLSVEQYRESYKEFLNNMSKCPIPPKL